MFITLEGPDGVGKSTQAVLLADWLEAQGVPVLLTREPGGTVTGAKIRHMLLDASLQLSDTTELLLFLADRAQHVEQLIRPALAEGYAVVCDRFGDSTLAYQGHARQRMATLRALPAELLYPLMPDLTLILDADPAACAARIAGRGVEANRLDEETMAFRQAVRAGFLAIAHEHPERCAVVDASQSEALVQADLRALVRAAYTQQKGRVYGPRPFCCTGIQCSPSVTHKKV